MAATRKPRSPSIAGGADHHRFLRPGALARLRDAKLRRRKHISRLPPPSSPSSSPTYPHPPPAGDGEGAMPHFAPVSRILGPRFPQRKKLTAAKAVVFISPQPPASPDRAVEAVLEFLSSPDMVVAAH